jgi:hypothetical protein
LPLAKPVASNAARRRPVMFSSISSTV